MMEPTHHIERIATGTYDEWYVLSHGADGLPVEVKHCHPAFRGSSLEAWLNLALAVRQVKVALRGALPGRIQRYVPMPKIWWYWPSGQG